jgi:hypothetical protein
MVAVNLFIFMVASFCLCWAVELGADIFIASASEGGAEQIQMNGGHGVLAHRSKYTYYENTF